MSGRLAIGGVGALVGVYGAILLLQQGWDNLVSTVIWMSGGVFLNDGILGITLIALGAFVVMTVPARIRGPLASGLIVLGTVTVTAIPVLGRFGARTDNATLLDRNYTLGWFVLAGLVALVTAGATLRHHRVSADAVADPEGVEREPHSEPDRPL